MPDPKRAGRAELKTVLIVDDHPIVRDGLSRLIKREGDMTVCCEAASAAEALKCATREAPDVAVVDISLEGPNGIELTKALVEQCPKLPVLILSMHDETLFAERALKAGAKGYIMKQEAGELIIKAIRKILAGELYVSENIASRLLSEFVQGPRGKGSPVGVEVLSDRELEVFELIGKGMRTRDIAKTLHMSPRTVETHRGRIKRKLKLKDAGELSRRAVAWIETEKLQQ